MNERALDSVLDEYLVVAGQGGDAKALKLLVRRWNDRFTRVAYHHLGDAEATQDVVQEAWLAVIRGLPRLNDPARFRAWALRIVSNKARDWIRREQRRRRAVGEAGREAPASVRTAAEPGHPLVERMRESLGRLPEHQRVVLTLYYLDGLGVPEVAEVLGIPAGTVKSRLFHARKELARSVTGGEQGDETE